MPTVTKTLTGPSRASKYPYRYQQDVKDRNDFRLKMKAELKAMARESFLEEMEKIRTSGLGNSGMGSIGSGLDSNTFDVTGNNNMSRFQRIVNEMQYQHGTNRNRPAAMQLEWSSPMIRNQGPVFSVMGSNVENSNDYSADTGGFLTARTDPGQSIGNMSPPQPLKKKQRAPGSNKNKDIPVGQMFVLSSAPINSHEKLVRDQIQQGSNIPLESSSLLEQANRYTELQSLFQPPAMSQELLESSNLLPSLESELAEEERQQQIRAQQQQQRQKLENNISQHKDRLTRSRHEERFYSSGLLAKSATSAKPTAPRSYQHNRGRRIIDTNQQQQPHTQGFTTSPYDTHSRSNSPQLHAASTSYQPHSLTQTSAYFPYDAASTAGARPTTSHTGSALAQSMNQPNNLQSNKSNQSLLTTDSMTSMALHAGAVAPPPSAVHAPLSNNNSLMFSTNASMVSAAPMQPLADPNNNQQQPRASSLTPLESTQDVISVDEFQKKTDQLDNDLRAVVRDVVHNEMLADGRAQHYTKRFMTKMMKEKEASLVDRIEKAVGEKIQSLQDELATLKAKKLRRFKRNNQNTNNVKNQTKRANNNTGKGKDARDVNDTSSIEDGNNNDDGSFFGGYYDIDDDELPNWLKNSGEILHVLERTQMNTGDAGDPHHIDVRTLNTEINRSIEMTLRRLLTGKHPGPEFYHHYAMYPDGTHTEASSMKLGGVASSEKSVSDVGKAVSSATATAGSADASVTQQSTGGSKVHGRIETGKDISKSTDGYGDFDKVGSTADPSISTVVSSTPVDLPTSIKAKKKSKAEKLLGLDGPPSGGPGGAGGGFHPMDPSSASSRPGANSGGGGGGGLFGSIGNLFSSKPGTTGNSMSPSMASSKPSMMMSMMSSRESTNSNSSAPVHAAARPGVGRPSMMAPIIDEGDEEASQKSSPNKNRPNSKNSDSSKRKVYGNPSGSMKKKKGHDTPSSDAHGLPHSDSTTSLQSKPDAGNTNNNNGSSTAEAGEDTAEDKPSGRVAVNDPPMNPVLLAELSKEESRYRELMQSLLSLADVKLNIKRELKDWEKQFTMKTGREPSAEDKATINDRYIAYKLATTQVQEAKDHVRACEDKLKEIRERAAAEQQQQLE